MLQRRGLALVEGHVPVLDPQRPAVDGLSYSHMSPAAKMPGDRGLEPRRAAHAARLAQLEPGRAGEHHVGHHAGADHHHVAVELQPALRDHLAARGRRSPRSARARRRRAPRPRAPRARPGRSRRPRGPNWRSSVTSSCITIEHCTPCAGGQRRRHLAADVAAADQHHALGLRGVLADRVGVAERAQVVDAVEVGAVGAQPAHVRAGGEQRLVEARPPPWSTAWPRARPGRASSRSCA